MTKPANPFIALLALTLAALLCGCDGLTKPPAQIELPKDEGISRDLPGNVYTPFDGVYPPEWPDFLKLPEGAYALGPISDETDPAGPEAPLRRQMVVYALVKREVADLRVEYSTLLEAQDYALVYQHDRAERKIWTGQSYIQRPDKLWYGVVVKPYGDTGRKGWTALVITVSLHQDLSGQWERIEGHNRGEDKKDKDAQEKTEEGAPKEEPAPTPPEGPADAAAEQGGRS